MSEMTLTKTYLRDGKWHGRVTMGVRDDGKPDRRHVERKTEAEVTREREGAVMGVDGRCQRGQHCRQHETADSAR